LKQIQAMNDLLRVKRIRRDLRQIIWMSAFSSAGVLMLLADAFTR